MELTQNTQMFEIKYRALHEVNFSKLQFPTMLEALFVATRLEETGNTVVSIVEAD
jgi:hypothetical protein